MAKPRMIIEGLAAEPRQRVSQDGQHHMLDISVAHTPRRFNEHSQQWENETGRNGEDLTLWARATFFNEQAHHLATLISKGMLLELEGEPRITTYEKDGETRVNLDLHKPIVKIIPRPTKDSQERPYQEPSSDPWTDQGVAQASWQ